MSVQSHHPTADLAKTPAESLELTPLFDKKEYAPDTPKTHSRFSYLYTLSIFMFPAALSFVYYTLIAANIYVSETRFIVRAATGGEGAGLASIVQTGSLSRAVDESYAVNEFLTSYDVIDQLETNNSLRTVLSKPLVDFVGRYPNFYTKDTRENLRRAYQQMVDIQLEANSGISTLRVKAYTPEDARDIAQALVVYAEHFINKLNDRSHVDAIKYAQALVEESSARVARAEARLAEYRNSTAMINPEKEAAAAGSSTAKLSVEIARIQAELNQQTALSPNNPGISATRERLSSYKQELEAQKRLVAGDSRSIASKIEGFEMLSLQRELAVRSLSFAVSSLETAKRDSTLQRLYLLPVTKANLPDEPELPRRLLMIVITTSICFALFWILRTFVETALEHRA